MCALGSHLVNVPEGVSHNRQDDKCAGRHCAVRHSTIRFIQIIIIHLYTHKSENPPHAFPSMSPRIVIIMMIIMTGVVVAACKSHQNLVDNKPPSSGVRRKERARGTDLIAFVGLARICEDTRRVSSSSRNA